MEQLAYDVHAEPYDEDDKEQEYDKCIGEDDKSDGCDDRYDKEESD